MRATVFAKERCRGRIIMSDKSNENEKKKRIAIIAGGIILALLIILAILLAVLLPKKCAKHVHTFDKEVAQAEYLKNAATHTSAAVYYKSCECGEKSTEETFVYGEAIPHTYDKEVVKAE